MWTILLNLLFTNCLVNNFHVGVGRTSYSASDTFTNTSYAPYRARPSSPYPWCSNSDSPGHWLAIDLGTTQSVNKIKMERKSSDTSYVLTYTVKYRNDEEPWTNYNNSEVMDLMIVGQHKVLLEFTA